MNVTDRFVKAIQEIVRNELNSLGLLNGDWHLGIVDEVLEDNYLKVRVDGGTQPQKIPCNPDVSFNVGDYVIVIYLNGNSKMKFVLCKRPVVNPF